MSDFDVPENYFATVDEPDASDGSQRLDEPSFDPVDVGTLDEPDQTADPLDAYRTGEWSGQPLYRCDGRDFVGRADLERHLSQRSTRPSKVLGPDGRPAEVEDTSARPETHSG